MCNLLLGCGEIIIYNSDKLIFPNGSKIQFVVQNKDEPNGIVRGYRAKYIWDVQDYISPECIDKVIKPFMNYPDKEQ